METNTSAYPLRLTGELSQRLSRGLWLVKWVLSSPRSSLPSWLGWLPRLSHERSAAGPVAIPEASRG